MWCFNSQRVKNRTAVRPAIALLGIYPTDTNAVKRWFTCTPVFIAAMSTIVKLEEAKMSFNRRMDKEVVYTYTHTHNGISLSHEKG